MASIFVSYRRIDAPGQAGRLYDRLVGRFGEANVFKDLDSLEPGADFADVIEATVDRCDALVAVIGRDWLRTQQGGERRLDDPRDWVRLEIANALRRRIRVVPVLVDGASMPSAADLPDDLKALAQRHGIKLSEETWVAQVTNLVDVLERPLAGPSTAEMPREAGPEPSPLVPHVALGRELVRVSHAFSVGGVAFSPDGKQFATASSDRSARVWDSDSGRELTRVTHAGSVWGVAFSPDGKQIATAGWDGSACVWDSASGRELARVTHGRGVSGVAFSPDGKQIVTGGFDTSACVWDSASGRQLLSVTHADVLVGGVAFGPEGKRIATASSDGSACVWDSVSGRQLLSVIHDGGVGGVAFSPDGKRIATASSDGSACVWDSASGRQLTRITHDGGLWDVAFSPDGKRIATASDDRTACVWDSANGRQLTRVTHDGGVRGVAFSPDGKRIVTACGGSRKKGTRFKSRTEHYGYATVWGPE